MSGGIYEHIDVGTLVAATITLLLIVGGYYDRRAKQKGQQAAPPTRFEQAQADQGRTCAQCVGPLLERSELLLRTVEHLVEGTAARMDRHAEVEAERANLLQQTLVDIRNELREIRRARG